MRIMSFWKRRANQKLYEDTQETEILMNKLLHEIIIIIVENDDAQAIPDNLNSIDGWLIGSCILQSHVVNTIHAFHV